VINKTQITTRSCSKNLKEFKRLAKSFVILNIINILPTIKNKNNKYTFSDNIRYYYLKQIEIYVF
jgi:hypothetical protein